jgi:hypothetical protein
MTPEPPETPDVPPATTRRQWAWAALLAGAIICVFAATVVRFTQTETPSGAPLPGDGRYADRDGSPGGPDQWLGARPAAAAGFAELAELPDDLVMPAGARRRTLVQYRRFGAERIKAEYVVEGALADVSTEMVDILTDAGWRLAETGVDRRPSAMVMHKDKHALSVRLHWRADSVTIVAVIHRAAPAGPNDR